jgi:hypothetical protein
MVRTFFQRFGRLGVCVLPAEVLSDDLLGVDPETHTIPTSLRKLASIFGLCYAHIVRSFAEGLYWAEVAATPDLVDAQRVVLTEAQLYHALPWDVRLQDRQPSTIRKLMFAHADTVQPVQRQTTPEQANTTPVAALTLAPIIPLEMFADATVEVTTSELQEVLDLHSLEETNESLFERITRKVKRLPFRQRAGSFTMQQAFLRVMIDALMTQLYQAQDHLAALSLKARCAVLAQMQRFHRLTRQRVVNAVPTWSEAGQKIVWKLTVGVPAGMSVAA